MSVSAVIFCIIDSFDWEVQVQTGASRFHAFVVGVSSANRESCRSKRSQPKYRITPGKRESCKPPVGIRRTEGHLS
jgi:hypothetical protein